MRVLGLSDGPAGYLTAALLDGETVDAFVFSPNDLLEMAAVTRPDAIALSGDFPRELAGGLPALVPCAADPATTAEEAARAVHAASVALLQAGLPLVSLGVDVHGALGRTLAARDEVAA